MKTTTSLLFLGLALAGTNAFAEAVDGLVPRDIPVDRAEFSLDGRKTWRPVRLPHDWAVEGAWNVTNGWGTGWLPYKGVGWYRTELALPASDRGRFVALRFGGVMARPEVYLNGERVGGWDYGYMSFEVDLTGKFRFGERNLLEVRADTTPHRSRWYPGAGIFRDVTLVVEDAVNRLVYGSLKISTPEISPTSALVHVEYRTPKSAVAGDFRVADPVLWDVDNPHLYSLELCGRTYRYGIRSAEFTADDGFHLNGRRVQLKGVNLHSDLGPLGMAFDRDAMRRQLRAMRDMGVNALRTSHNACDPAVLDLCDEMGIVVWNECYDKWDDTASIRKGVESLEESVARNLRQFVRRDRNHPCVVAWSIGNEIRPADECGEYDGMGDGELYVYGSTRERCRLFREAVRAEDTTRPVGMGCCFQSAIAKGHYADLDLTGWNYGAQYNAMRRAYPDKPVVYTESASAFSSFGFYRQPMSTNAVAYADADRDIDSYDRCSASWADIPDIEFARMERDRHCAGEFVWTGIDYLGEPTPSPFARSSYFGICDLTALPKDRYYLYRAHWNGRDETVHLLPHWNWEGREGEPVTVMCYTSGDEAELFVNGKSAGRRRKLAKAPCYSAADDPGSAWKCRADYYDTCWRYRIAWEVPYAPGEIRVVAYRAGERIGEDVRRTAGRPVAVRLTPEEPSVASGGLGFVRVELVDAHGTVEPLAADRVNFRLEGPGEIVAVGNGSPHAHESFQAVESHPLYYGRALAVIRRNAGARDPIRLVATCGDLRAAKATLK